VSALLASWKPIALGLLVAAVICAGWNVAKWKQRSDLLDAAKAEIRHQIERTARSDADRLALEVKIAGREDAVKQGAKIIKETVVEYVKDNRDCDVSEPVASQLQRARAGQLPTAAAEALD